MRNFKKRFFQYLADYIIERLQFELNSQFYNEKVFYFYLEMGICLDFYCTEYFKVELD